MDQIGREPAVGKSRTIGAAEDDGPGLAQVVDHGAVAARDHVALDLQTVGGGKTVLVDIDLHRNGNASKAPGILSPRDRRIHLVRLLEHVFRAMVDDGVEHGVDGIQPRQPGSGRLPGGNLSGPDERGEVSGRQAPEILHGLLRCTRAVLPPTAWQAMRTVQGERVSKRSVSGH